MNQFQTQSHHCQNAVIYARVSSIAQTKRGSGLESQQTRCREYAAYKNYSVVKVFEDDLSGSTAKRPGMEALLAFLRKHRNTPHIVLIDDISRLARDVKSHIELRAAITLAGGILESPTLEFGDDADSELQEYILATVSQHQRKKNAEQTLNRMQARVMSGYYVFQCPIGFKYEKVHGHGKMLMRNEPLATILQEGMEGYASGRLQTQAEVMRYFQSFPEFPKDKNGLVRNQRVKDILTRPVYAGMVEAPSWNISLREGKHEGLISFAMFQKIQHRLNDLAAIQAPARIDLNHDFPLRGAINCGDCGSILTACWSKGERKRYAYYLCHTRGCVSYRKSIPRDKVEGEFEAMLKTLQPSTLLFQAAKAMFQNALECRLAQAFDMKQTAQKQIVKLEKQIQQVLDRILDSSNSTVITAYEERIANMEKEKLVLSEKLRNSSPSQRTFEDLFERALIFLSNPQKIWATGIFEHRRLLLRLSFSDKLTYHRKTGLRTPQTALPFRLLEGLSIGKKEVVHPERFERPAF